MRTEPHATSGASAEKSSQSRPYATRPSTSSASASRPHGPNILIILSGAQARGFTGFEGNRHAKTPNLDKLASTAMEFTRCYVPTPQRGPSEAALLTGRYPHANDVMAPDTPLAKRAETFTGKLKAAGYSCGFVGGWDIPGAQPADRNIGFTDYTATSDAPATEQEWLNASVHVNGVKKAADKYLDDWHADRAVEAIGKLADRPFLLVVAMRGPDQPLVYPSGVQPPADIDSLPLPDTRTQDQTLFPKKLFEAPAAREFKRIIAQPDLQEKYLRSSRARYLAMISRVDENVGRILRRLDELRLLQRTIVVFTSLHGIALSEHALFGQAPAFYDEFVRVPLLIRGVADEEPRNIERLVANLDVGPTLCELAGVDPPRTVQGKSFAALLHDEPAPGWADERFLEYYRSASPPTPKDAAVTSAPAGGAAPGSSAPAHSTVPGAPPGSSNDLRTPVPPGAPMIRNPDGSVTHAPAAPGVMTPSPAGRVAPSPAAGPTALPGPAEVRVRGLVTGNFKFIDYLDDDDQLFDLKRDPSETHNVLNDFHYTVVRRILSDRLARWRKETRDPWQ